jgi:hypothetical protein
VHYYTRNINIIVLNQLFIFTEQALNSDGTFYAEYDVVKPHPEKAKWFVEGVTAWGKADQIKSEAKLLAMPE